MAAPSTCPALPAQTPFQRMRRHGEVQRAPAPVGSVILSQLPPGASRVVSSAASVKFVLSGEETYYVAGRPRRVREGEFLIADAGTDLQVRTSSSVGLCIYLPGEMEADEGCDPLALVGAAHEPLARFLRRVAAALAPAEEVRPDVVNRVSRAAEGAALAFVGRFQARMETLGPLKSTTRAELLRRLERARGRIHECADGRVTLEELAREAALSKFHFTRLFARAYGCAPLSYHRRRRLGRAAVLIRQGLSVSAAAEQVGYSSVSAFSRAFGAERGTSPSALATDTRRD